MVLKAIILGVIQGLTEFLPVSSTAHLVLIPEIFNWSDFSVSFRLSFDVALHLGTLLALLVYFRTQWLMLLKGFGRSLTVRPDKWKKEMKLAWLIIIGCIPAGLAGIFLNNIIENGISTISWVVVFLIAGSIPMLAAEFYGKKSRGFVSVGYLDSITMGMAQALALAPGVSRSGITISTGMLMGLDRESAAHFAFLMSAPVIAGAGLWEGIKLVKRGFPIDLTWVFVAGFLSAAITGFIAIKFMLKYLTKGSLTPFIIYRIALAILILIIIVVK